MFFDFWSLNSILAHQPPKLSDFAFRHLWGPKGVLISSGVICIHVFLTLKFPMMQMNRAII